MDSWLSHMPKGMMLKSDGFASNIYDPEGNFTLQKFCADKGIEYAHTGVPVKLETFSCYGLAFSKHLVPEIENRIVKSVERTNSEFTLRLEDGEIVNARRVVLAVGITHFDWIPENLAHLPSELLSHSATHHDLEPFRGRRVIVIGAGSSAIDLAGLLPDVGAEVQLVARRTSLNFHTKPQPGKCRSRWQQIRHPQSGLGPGMRSRFFADAPMAFHYLPEGLRLEAVRRTLGPSAGWFAKDKLIPRVPLVLGHTPEQAFVRDGQVHLTVRSAQGTTSELVADHIVAATGYKVDLQRLKFLSSEILSKIDAVNNTPILCSNFESSVHGLYFAGVSAANSFGPVMRFAFGAGFAARTIAKDLAKVSVRDTATVQVPSMAAVAK